MLLQLPWLHLINSEIADSSIFSKAGSGVMSIDYLGQTFKGDLLPNGQIKSQETGLFFKNPSAWAIYCKKIVNPSKKSGCGWASVKYKGRKMDHFKAVWSSKMKAAKLTESVQRPDMDEGNSNSSEIEVIQEIRYTKVPLINIPTSQILRYDESHYSFVQNRSVR